MIVFCEECGEKNLIEEDQLKDIDVPVRCKRCKDILRFSHPHLKKTQKATPPPKPSPGQDSYLPQLDLKIGETVISINQIHPTVTMGRQEHNDIEVIDTRVSRSHARIEFRDGQFILIDHSTNGTYVLIQKDAKGINLKRGELALKGDGIITLGRKVPDEASKTIHFSFKTQ